MISSESDEVLLERLQRGNLAAFDVLYARHARHVYGYVLSATQQVAEAEDVVQETFVAIARQRQGPVRNVRAWLFQIARNICFNRARRAQRAHKTHEQISHTPEKPAHEPPADETLHHLQVGAALEQAISRLPSSHRELYRLRASGLSYEELAEALAVPLGTIKSRLHEIVRRLKEELAS